MDTNEHNALQTDLENLFKSIFFNDFYLKKDALYKSRGHLIFRFHHKRLKNIFHPKLDYETMDILKDKLDTENKMAIKFQAFEHATSIYSLLKKDSRDGLLNFFELSYEIESYKEQDIINFNTNSLFFKYQVIGV